MQGKKIIVQDVTNRDVLRKIKTALWNHKPKYYRATFARLFDRAQDEGDDGFVSIPIIKDIKPREDVTREVKAAWDFYVSEIERGQPWHEVPLHNEGRFPFIEWNEFSLADALPFALLSHDAERPDSSIAVAILAAMKRESATIGDVLDHPEALRILVTSSLLSSEYMISTFHIIDENLESDDLIAIVCRAFSRDAISVTERTIKTNLVKAQLVKDSSLIVQRRMAHATTHELHAVYEAFLESLEGVDNVKNAQNMNSGFHPIDTEISITLLPEDDDKFEESILHPFFTTLTAENGYHIGNVVFNWYDNQNIFEYGLNDNVVNAIKNAAMENQYKADSDACMKLNPKVPLSVLQQSKITPLPADRDDDFEAGDVVTLPPNIAFPNDCILCMRPNVSYCTFEALTNLEREGELDDEGAKRILTTILSQEQANGGIAGDKAITTALERASAISGDHGARARAAADYWARFQHDLAMYCGGGELDGASNEDLVRRGARAARARRRAV